MPLIDCFIELIGYVSYLLKALPNEQPRYDRVRSDVEELIKQAQTKCQAATISANDFELAQFAVFAWIDEALLNSQWQEKMSWQKEQLQRTYFQTADAGELFFDKLNELQPQQLEVREVYFICLALGFTGRYCNPGDEFLLQQLKSSNLKLIGGGQTVGDLTGGRLFPEAYHDGTSVSLGGRRKLFGLATLIGGGVPVLLLVLLFGVYRFVLTNVGQNLIQSIR